MSASKNFRTYVSIQRLILNKEAELKTEKKGLRDCLTNLAGNLAEGRLFQQPSYCTVCKECE